MKSSRNTLFGLEIYSYELYVYMNIATCYTKFNEGEHTLIFYKKVLPLLKKRWGWITNSKNLKY